MVRDYISETINGVKIGGKAKKENIVVPFSLLVENLLKVLKSEGYVVDFSRKGKKIPKYIEVTLNLSKVIDGAQRVSKSSKRVYTNSKDIKVGSRMSGVFILTTPKGVMTHKEAKKQNVGGEVLCKLW
jgi:small subunit ribosomal protein S8